MSSRYGRGNSTRLSSGFMVAFCLFMLLILISTHPVFAEDNGLPADYQPSESDNRDLSDNTGQNRYGIPWHQFKNILTEETVTVQEITVLTEPDDDWSDPEPVSGISFRIYNTTTQTTESIITTDQDGVLHMPPMKRGHTYILMAVSNEYIIDGAHNIYLWALAEGDQNAASEGAYEHKADYVRLEDDDPVPTDYLKRISEITVHEASDFYDPMYYSMDLPVEIDGQPAPDGIQFRFTSAENGSVEATTLGGQVKAELVEDTDYTVHVVDDQYDIDTFTLAVKDKSEHKFRDSMGSISSYGRYCYDHTCCQGADKLILESKDSVSHEGSISSLKKDEITGSPLAEVTGMDFKTLLLLVRYPSVEIPEASGVTDYDTVELTLANPHRWEKCKVTDIEFTVTMMLPQQRTVRNVYQLRDGALEALTFSQSSKDAVVFTMDSMSLYPVVVEYASEEPASPEEEKSKPAERAEPETAAPEKANTETAAPEKSEPPAAVVPAATAKTESDTKPENKQPEIKIKAAKVSKPKSTKIKKLKPGKKKFTVTWKKQTKNTTGYHIQYSTRKNFKKAKSVKVKGAKKTKKTIKKLKSGKKYYVRIRTYRRYKGKTYYSSWSKAKTVKVR